VNLAAFVLADHEQRAAGSVLHGRAEIFGSFPKYLRFHQLANTETLLLGLACA
jgi:hypothetical protein